MVCKIVWCASVRLCMCLRTGSIQCKVPRPLSLQAVLESFWRSFHLSLNSRRQIHTRFTSELCLEAVI